MPEKMSTTSQNNGKKSSNSSMANTPSSTPLTGLANGQSNNAHNSPPPNNNAPKYGTLVPNRIFVGGISANTTEGELMELFSNYGTVKAAKIIQDRAGVSKGYGFITFESEDDAKRPLREAENIVLRERKLNIAPAIKKQPFNRAFDASSPPAVAAGNPAQFFFPPGAAMPYFQGGVTYYHQPAPPAPGDPVNQQPVYQPPPVYPAQSGPPQAATYPSMMFPAQTIYMPQQYPMPMPYDYNYYQSNGGPPASAQYMVGAQGPGGPQCPPMPPSSSPPRPPCYGQQMPAYSPADSLFYNLPVYGAAMEAPPVYADPFDLGPAGPYGEDARVYSPANSGTGSGAGPPSNSNSVANVEHAPPAQQQHQPQPQPQLQQQQQQQQQHYQPTAPAPPQTAPRPQDYVERTANNGHAQQSAARLQSQQQQQQQQQPAATNYHQTQGYNGNSNNADASRNTNTPVVSLLSIDHQQEKDYLSMQGGRRRKPPTVAHNHGHGHGGQQMYQPNGYLNPMAVGFNPSQMYAAARHANGYDNRYRNANANMNMHMNMNANANSRRKVEVRRSNEIRCYDENKNKSDDKVPSRTCVNTPPPAPYSPMTHQFKTRYNNNNNGNSGGSPAGNSFRNVTRVVSGGGGGKGADSNNVDNVENVGVHSQVQMQQHGAPSGAQQSFVQGPPQARRSRRSIRRNGGGPGEMGAGDAPMQPVESADVCKKFETLKI